MSEPRNDPKEQRSNKGEFSDSSTANTLPWSESQGFDVPEEANEEGQLFVYSSENEGESWMNQGGLSEVNDEMEKVSDSGGEDFFGQGLASMRTKLSDIEEGDEEHFDFESFDLPPHQFQMGDLNDEEGEAAFLAQYNEDFVGDVDLNEDVLPPRGENVTVKCLEQMLQMLEVPELEDEGIKKDGDCGVFKSLPTQSVLYPATPLGDTPSKPEIEEDRMIVLGPDHPKMQRFQAALKRHLQKQIYLEECAAREIEIDLKAKRKENHELGKQLYNLQYELTRQNEVMEKNEFELQILAENQHKIDAETEELQLSNEKLQLALEKEILEESKLMKSVKEIDLTEWCIREAIRDYESQIKISQRVDERFQKLKVKAEMEKKDQDIYLDRLMLRLQQTEQSNSGLQRQIEAHAEEQKELNTFIAEATTEIDALQIEKVHLQRSWNETIAVVRSRDEALSAARKTLEIKAEELNLKEKEIKQLMKDITKEQEQHEKATVRLKRRKMEERQLKTRFAALESQSTELQENLAMLQNLRNQMEHEYAINQAEFMSLEKMLEAPRSRIHKLRNEKKSLEDEILGIIQEKTALDKVTQGIAKQIHRVREKNQSCEDEIIKIENEMTQVTYECEVLQTDLLKQRGVLTALEKKRSNQEKLIESQEKQLLYSDSILQKKNIEIQNMSTKLAKLSEEQDNLGVNKLEEEVAELEKQISVNRTNCVDLQEKWLKLQDELVGLTIKRDEILTENDLKRKEEFILERKRQRLLSENEVKREGIRKLQRSIKEAQREITVLHSKLFEGREEEESTEKQNFLLQNEIVNVLKDAELEAIQLQDEITRLECERDRTNRELSDAHEQCLIWEKKVKLAKELKMSIKKEQENSTTQLKLAIHHMQVRHNELRRAQEKLMTDMERCIDKRERIIQQADYNVKKNNIHPNKILLNIQREEIHVTEKQRKLIKEAHEAEMEVKKAEENITQLQDKMKCETETLHSIQKIIDAADEKLCEAAIEKHKNLIEIILRQIKYKTLEAVNLNRFQIQPNPKQVEDEISKLEERCYAIVELCDALLEQYPEYKLPIKLVKASILPNVE